MTWEPGDPSAPRDPRWAGPPPPDPAAGGSHGAHFRAMLERPGKRFGPRLQVPGFDKKACAPILDRLRDPAHSARYYRHAEAERLDLRHAEGLVERGHHDELAPHIERWQIAHEPREADVGLKAQSRCFASQRCFERAYAGDHVADIRNVRS